MRKQKRVIGEGEGKPGRYCGLADPYGAEAFSKIVLLPVPFDLTTTYQKGTDQGPMALIEASRHLELYDIETDSEVFKHGIYTAPPVKAKTSKKMLEETYKRTKELLAKEKFVITLGGEHSISYGPIRAHLEHYKKLTVLQFDAHADLAETYENNPWSHASVMARVKRLKGIQKIVSVGIRSMSHGELALLDRPNTFFAHEIVNNPRWISSVLKTLSGPIYISFDLDVFDSCLMPSTGTPEPGGLFWYDVLKLLRQVIEKKNVVGCDVVELLPKASDPSPDFLAAKLVYKMLSYKFKPE
jgi:agmatinase